MEHLKESIAKMRDDLIRNAGTDVIVRRAGVVVLASRAILAKTKYEDADGSNGRYNTFYVDVLFSAEDMYKPQAGDTIEADNAFYIVKPITSELWRYDDTYKQVIRVHAQKGR